MIHFKIPLIIVLAVSVNLLCSCCPHWLLDQNCWNRAKIIKHQNFEYEIFLVELPDTDLQLFWKKPSGEQFNTISTLKYWLKENNQELLFATNAGIYEPGYIPTGLHVEQGIELCSLNTREQSWGNFFLQPNAVFYVSDRKAGIMETTKYAALSITPELAVQSGPALVLDGFIHPKFDKQSNNRTIRSGVGIINENLIVFAISRGDVNLWEFASLFKDRLGCAKALYLDGAISEMYVPESGMNQTVSNFAGIFAVVK